MKKLGLLISMVFCFAMCSFGQTDNTVEQDAGIVFDTLVHDYGTITKGSDGKCAFKFKNTSDTPLILTNVQASCGCTVPSWPREAIKPGESSAIDVKYNTNNVGHFTKRISVFTNKQNTPIILMIKGSVVEATVVPSTEETK